MGWASSTWPLSSPLPVSPDWFQSTQETGPVGTGPLSAHGSRRGAEPGSYQEKQAACSPPRAVPWWKALLSPAPWGWGQSQEAGEGLGALGGRAEAPGGTSKSAHSGSPLFLLRNLTQRVWEEGPWKPWRARALGPLAHGALFFWTSVLPFVNKGARRGSLRSTPASWEQLGPAPAQGSLVGVFE